MPLPSFGLEMTISCDVKLVRAAEELDDMTKCAMMTQVQDPSVFSLSLLADALKSYAPNCTLVMDIIIVRQAKAMESVDFSYYFSRFLCVSNASRQFCACSLLERSKTGAGTGYDVMYYFT